MRGRRFIELECARGIASIVVMLHHFALGFCPDIKEALRLTPLFALLNGTGAVIFFFVLSGFVLTYATYKSFSATNLATAIGKRLPRLMVPAGASILLGYLILKYLFAPHVAAADYTHSQWLRDFADAHFPALFQPSLTDALQQTLFVFFRSNDFYYNSNLWTMKVELFGSLLVFALALVSGAPILRSNLGMLLLHVSLAALMFLQHSPYLPFVAGSYLAFWMAHSGANFHIPASLSIALLLAAILAFSTDAHQSLEIVASLCVIVALLGNESIGAKLSGKIGALLGAVSFPLYLVHTLVIVSISSLVYAQMSLIHVERHVALIASLLVTIVVAAVASLPMLALDKASTAWLSGLARTLVDWVSTRGRVSIVR